MSGGGAAPGVRGPQVVVVKGGNGLGGSTGGGDGVKGGGNRDRRDRG